MESNQRTSAPTLSSTEGKRPISREVFRQVVTSTYERAEKEGFLRYSVNVDEKTLRIVRPRRGSSRRKAYPVHIVEGRATAKRPASAPPVQSILQPFQEDKFHFLKVSDGEILFYFRCPSLGDDLHPVIVNASPAVPSHCLLVPFRSCRLPQVLTREALSVGLEFAAASSSSAFRVGFNSMGAFASVNHLHFQGYFLPDAIVNAVEGSNLHCWTSEVEKEKKEKDGVESADGDSGEEESKEIEDSPLSVDDYLWRRELRTALPTDTAPIIELACSRETKAGQNRAFSALRWSGAEGLEHVGVGKVVEDTPARHFVVSVSGSVRGYDKRNAVRDALQKVVFSLLEVFHAKDVAYNLTIVPFDDGDHHAFPISRVCLFPRKGIFNAKSDFAFNPAFLELSGHILVKSRDRLAVEDAETVEEWLREVTLPLDRQSSHETAGDCPVKGEGQRIGPTFEELEREWDVALRSLC